MGQAQVMSHLMSDGGGEADGVVMMILEEKRRAGALNSAEFTIKQPNASSPDDSCEFDVITQT